MANIDKYKDTIIDLDRHCDLNDWEGDFVASLIEDLDQEPPVELTKPQIDKINELEEKHL